MTEQQRRRFASPDMNVVSDVDAVSVECRHR
jgi:hypothetical protein